MGVKERPFCRVWVGPTVVQMILNSDIEVGLLDTNGWTPLHWACRSDSRKTVQLLRSFGANINKKDENGWTPHDVAIFCQNESLSDLLQDGASLVRPKHLITEPGKNHYYDCSSCYHVSYVSTRL
jgi:ankyrin repeat protein